MSMTIDQRAPAADSRPEAGSAGEVRVVNLTAWYGERAGVRDINPQFPAQKVTAIIGPSGCGKSTLLRCINRMHEVVKHARVDGQVLSVARTSTAWMSTPQTCARAWAWCSSARTLSRPCRSGTTSASDRS
jgi:ABC-type transport system involved in cytochrome bd biosynthesis fused ATPase/permease subunit